jgi:hypothetical protein
MHIQLVGHMWRRGNLGPFKTLNYPHPTTRCAFPTSRTHLVSSRVDKRPSLLFTDVARGLLVPEMLRILQEGFVSARNSGSSTAVAAGSRCAVTTDGNLICTFVVQSKLAINDFVSMRAVSLDHGVTWQEPQPIWPHLRNEYSIFCSVSRAPSGELFLYGTRTRIDTPGESFWSDVAQGMKENELIWARSFDGGRNWTEPAVIPTPIPGSAEAPGALCVTRDGRWLACYAPYNTFDTAVTVDRNQVVVLFSDDQGSSWRYTSMFRFAEQDSGGAEAWVIELAGGKLLGACWQVAYAQGKEYPNPFVLSADGGHTWTPSRSTGILGQSTALAALPDGRALLVYNQRKHGEPGVWLATARPSETEFGIESNEIVWRADRATQHASSMEHTEWSDFAFGEPSITVVPDGTLLVTLWCIQPSGQGIRYVKLKLEDAG